MILFYIFTLVLIPFMNANSMERPSYRSSVMEGDKPILRMSEALNFESESEEYNRLDSLINTQRHPKMVKDLSFLVAWLMENFGYDIVQQGRRNKDAPVLYVPQKETLKTHEIKAKNKSTSKHKKSSKTSPGQKHRKKVKSKSKIKTKTKTKSRDKLRTYDTTEGKKLREPSWTTDLKEFIKDLITRFGQDDLVKYTKPVIASLEKKHNVKVLDIDVDQYGEILINYVNKGERHKAEPKALRYNPPEEESSP